ncbi:MAG TPA: ABC transporter substrate-binding protein, partial [Streptosporangiaceae bacterium]
MRRLTAIGSLITAGLLAAACSAGAGPSGNGTAAAKNVVTISNENGALWTCQFSPFNGSDTLLSVGFVYETLAYDNPLQSGKTTPMLASSWQWGAGNKSITFTIRKGVKFSDGTPMSAADVVFTFNLLKKYPALDLTGAWSVLSSVTQTGSDQVVMDFKSAAVPAFYFIAGQTPIVPEHIWSKIANPVTFADTNPIGTGPYVVNPCAKANITYTANKHYWQPGEPHIAKVEYPAYTSNNTANDQLANGQAQWGSQYIPAIKTFYTAKSPNFHYWFPPTVNVSLVPNLKNSLLSNVKVREAMSYAIDRSKVSTIGESGYEPPANQAGIVTPTFSSWLDTSAVAKFGNAYDPAKAKQLLASAGFKLGSDGIMANGQAQWGSQYIPSIKSFYTAKSPNFHYWFPPTVNVSLIPNLKNSLLSNVKVRQAMSDAIDRAKVSSIGESGYEPPANQAGIVTPTFSSWLNSSLISKYHYSYDPARAKQILASAGFKMGSDGIMANSKGQKLSFSVINIGDYSDWVASMQVVAQNLKA